MTVFKNYDGQDIEMPTHKHSVDDTKRNGTTAYATLYEDGFMMKEDRIRLTNLKSKMDFLNERMQTAVYLTVQEPPKIATLLTGQEINTKLKSVGSDATSLIFTNKVIPDDKLGSAQIVSTSDSDSKAYMYLDGDTIYVAPETEDTIIQANENCNNMFNYCISLNYVYFNNFDTSNVTDIGGMFSYSGIKSVDLSKFSTAKLTNINFMFYQCYYISGIDLSNIDVSNITNMSDMFNGCKILEQLDISTWDTSKVTNMNNMFRNCPVLSSSITIMNAKTTSYSNMFNACSTSEGSKFTVNYIDTTTKDIATKMVATATSGSNVTLGSQV